MTYLIAERRWSELALWLALWAFAFLAGPVVAGLIRGGLV